MFQSSVPFLVCVVGAFAYVASKTNPDIKEMGRIAFAFGLLVTLFVIATHVVKF